ncbi:MAG TPA: pitrilysin family protein [Bryobacterales bacterium]|nr:pitrilysin family protein [Bryobacterales bacterium]
MKDYSRRIFALLLLAASAAWAQKVPVQEFTLPNGMKFLLLPRKGDPNVAVGWVARVGSVNERPGITGISHLFEHMMFKGTHVIGAKDMGKDLTTLHEIDAIHDQIRAEEEALIEKYRRGLIDDPKDPKYRTPRHKQLLEQYDALVKQARQYETPSEFDRLYTQNGGSSLNAGTDHDFTIYFVNVPANKLELWFWLESDRLANHVFRDFYTERDVVHEERRMRTDSTPIGRFEEEFDSMFWESSPYAWPVVGWPSDLEGITQQDAESYFGVYYAPNNITACLLGDFDPDQAKELAAKYFGRLQHGARDPQPVRTQEVRQLAEQRMIAYADSNPQVHIRYHTVADNHVDEPPLIMLANILNGRTGRLYQSLVLEQQLANSVSADSNGLKYEGYFELSGVARQGKDPVDVEKALYKEIEKLQKTPVPEHELEKVKNQQLATNFRRLQSNFGLMIQLLIDEATGSWQTINTYPQKLQAVTADDIQRVAKKYFSPENRSVALYYTKASATPQQPAARPAGVTQ